MKKKPARKFTLRKHVAAATTLIAATVTGAFFYLSSGRGNPMKVPAYTVLRVIDGDTFETTEKQLIRLASTEAPELEFCGGKEAREELESLVMGKPIYIKIIYRDPYMRLVSQVYTTKLYINKEMIERGFARYHNRDKGIGEELKGAGEHAREKKVGIFSSTCTQTENTKKPSCNIKGNIVDNHKIYFVPSCGLYNRTVVQLHLGDQWFCTEKEAEGAGFRKPVDCP